MKIVDMGRGRVQDKLTSNNLIIKIIGNWPFLGITKAPTNWPWEDDRI
jgi:hypothetical protein